MEDDTNMDTPRYLDLAEGSTLAYHRLAPQGAGASLPGIVFLGGFRSDMTGTKALHLEAWCRERGRACLRFDYRGHGASSGDFAALAISDWAADAEAAITRLTEGPQILVGSSMGGWLALLMAKRMPGRIAGIVGIAAAPDFTEAMWAEMSAEEQEELMRRGAISLPSEYSEEPYLITRRLIEDGRRNLVLTEPLVLPMPLRLLQGTADRDVPVSLALRILGHVSCEDARLTLVKGADHRFSGARELAVITETLDEITRAAVGKAAE